MGWGLFLWASDMIENPISSLILI